MEKKIYRLQALENKNQRKLTIRLTRKIFIKAEMVQLQVVQVTKIMKKTLNKFKDKTKK